MNELTLVRKNLFRKPVRTTLLLVSIFIAFLMFGVLVSFNRAITTISTLPTRMVTMSKINFTESLPISYYDTVARTDGVLVATHTNWFGGYYRDPTKGFLPVFAVDPQTYLKVYEDDLKISAAARKAFMKDRTAMLVPEATAKSHDWHVGQRVPINSNIYSQSDGSHTWQFTVAGIIPAGPTGSRASNVIIRYDYFNETITFGRDRIGWVAFLTASARLNDKIAHAIDARFANSSDETSTQDEATFSKSFADQLGNIALVVSLVVGAAFAAILLIVGTTMALTVRERTSEVGVMKTLGFSSGRVLRMVLAESLLLALLGAGLGMLGAEGLLYLLAHAPGSRGAIPFAPQVVGWAALIALALGLITGFAPAMGAYRMRITDAFGRR